MRKALWACGWPLTAAFTLAMAVVLAASASPAAAASDSERRSGVSNEPRSLRPLPSGDGIRLAAEPVEPSLWLQLASWGWIEAKGDDDDEGEDSGSGPK